jgi:CHAT domain-containing protein/tetratricopeptide (TPR) repeat protein
MLGLATLARHRYDYVSAERTYLRLVAGRTDGYAVYAHLGLAEGYEARSMALEAPREFNLALSAARTIGDRLAAGEALIWLSFLRGRLEGVRIAQALLDTAAAVIPSSALDLQARMQSRLAIVSALNGRAAEASARADYAVLLARRAQDPLVEADAFRIIGQVLQYRGQWDSALVALRQSEELYRRSHNRSALASSLIWHAQVLGSLLRFGEMRDVAQRAITEGEVTHNPSAVAQGHRALGVLYEMLGDWPGATVHLRKAMAISESLGDSSGMQSTGKYLVQVSLAAGDVATARRLTQARIAKAKHTEDANELYEANRSMADIATREGDKATAARALADARAQLGKLPGGDHVTWLLHDEARHALSLGNLGDAERLLNEYLTYAERGSCNLCRYDARVRLADVYARRQDMARTERELLKATDDLDQWRARLGDTQLRTLAFQSSVTIDEAGAEPNASQERAARVLGALVAGGRAEVAFGLAERWRARELTDRLVRAAALRTTPGPLRYGMGSLLGSVVRNAADMTGALPDEHTALIEYVVAEGSPVTVFVVQRSGLRARVLPPVDSLAERVARFGSLLESGASAEKIGRSLGAALVDPALALLDPAVTRVILVPDGSLHRLPFEALRLANGRYVIEAYSVGYAPSASAVAALARQKSQVQQASAARMLAIGNPAVITRFVGADGDASRDASVDDDAAALRRVRALPALAGAAREAKLVARYAPASDVRVGTDATAAFLKRTDLRNYRVLHFAAHALVDEQSVTRTALALAPGGGENGIVGAGDLAALQLDADLVVLSACRSAGGVLVGGEGVQGLTSPLLQAGARSVVATLWRIPDQGVVSLVESFYDGLSRGLPVADALRAAKLGALKRGDSPRVWAAFLVIGDPLVQVPLRVPPPKPWWWAVLP